MGIPISGKNSLCIGTGGCWRDCIIVFLTHWGRDKMAAIFQTTFSNAFYWMKMFKFRLRFHWSLFPRVQLTIFQHWFRSWLGAGQATSHYLKCITWPQWVKWVLHWLAWFDWTRSGCNFKCVIFLISTVSIFCETVVIGMFQNLVDQHWLR